MDIDFLLFLQGLRNATTGVLDDMFVQFSVFGEPFYVLLLMGIIYWCISKRMGVYLFMGWGINRLVNGFLKITFCVYRPWIRDPRIKPLEAALEKATGYSFPSGHTTNGAAVFGGLALRRELARPLRIGLWSIVILIGFSRNWVGVHTPQDVLVALGAGVVFMLLAGWICDWLERNPSKDVVVAAAIAVASIALIVYAATKSYPVHYDEAGNLLVDPQKMATDSFKNAGWALGFAVGWLAERRLVRFEVTGTIQQKCCRAVWGCLAIMVAYFPVTELAKVIVPGGVGSSVACFLQLLTIVFLVPLGISRLEKSGSPQSVSQ